MKQLFCLLTIAMLMCNCGSGMIGLLRTDKNENLIMDNSIYTLENGCEYTIEVVGYFETNIECGSNEILDVFYEDLIVEKTCGQQEPKILENPYTQIIAKSLHSEYLKLICGE